MPFKLRACSTHALSVCAFIILLLTSGNPALAAKPGRVARTLKVNERLSIYSYQCSLSIRSSSTSSARVRCSASSKHSQSLPVGHFYLRAKQSARIKAKSCLLQVVTNSAKLVKLRCTPPVAEISATPSSLSLTVDGSPGSFTITNNSTTITATNIEAVLPSGWSDVVQDSSGCVSVAPGASCQISIAPGSSTHSQTSIQIEGSNTSIITAQLVIDPVPPTTLSASVSNLLLSVNSPGVNFELAGNSRVITITNDGANTAFSINYNVSPALPSGTTISSTCSNLAASSSCTLTITPGSTPSATPGDMSPVPLALTVSGSNTNTLTPNVHVLAYGSVYQGGYVFSIDDTTPTSGSIGGKVAALSDQSAGVSWDPGCPGSCTNPIQANNVFDGQPNSSSISGALNSTYAATSYAAGLCAVTIAGYNDWYLPAICEMGYGSGGIDPCGSSASPTIQNIQSNLVDNNIISLVDTYWSSTQTYTVDPYIYSTLNQFGAGGNQPGDFKEISYPVRCVRKLTQ